MPRLLNLSDTEIVECFYAGQEKAFDVLLHRYQKDVCNVVQHCVKDRLVTEDLSQDVFLKIYTSLKRRMYNEEGKFLPWALRIARNICMDYLRKAAHFPPSGQILHNDYLSTDTRHNAETKLAMKEQEQQLNVFISRLPDDQKKVVYYRYYEQRSFKEIAALMNTNVNTSLGRMRYGLAHLRKQIANTPSFVI